MLVFVLAALALAVPVMLVHRHYDAAIEQLTDRLERYRRIIAMAPGLKAGLEKVKARDGRKFYLKNAAPALAAAEIQEIAKTIIEAQSGKLTSIQIIPHKDDGGYRQIAVNLQFSGSIASIQKILYALETRQPYLFVGNLSIQSPPDEQLPCGAGRRTRIFCPVRPDRLCADSGGDMKAPFPVPTSPQPCGAAPASAWRW